MSWVSEEPQQVFKIKKALPVYIHASVKLKGRQCNFPPWKRCYLHIICNIFERGAICIIYVTFCLGLHICIFAYYMEHFVTVCIFAYLHIICNILSRVCRRNETPALSLCVEQFLIFDLRLNNICNPSYMQETYSYIHHTII